MPRRHELTDEQWNPVGDLFLGKQSDPGRTAADNRLFVSAVLFVLKTGNSPGRPAGTVWEAEQRLETIRSMVCQRRLGTCLSCHR